MFQSKHEVKMAEYYYFCAFIDAQKLANIQPLRWPHAWSETWEEREHSLPTNVAGAICGLNLLLVLSLALRGFFPGTPVFPSFQKPAFPNSKLTRNKVDEEPLSGSATSKSLFMHLFLYI